MLTLHNCVEQIDGVCAGPDSFKNPGPSAAVCVAEHAPYSHECRNSPSNTSTYAGCDRGQSCCRLAARLFANKPVVDVKHRVLAADGVRSFCILEFVPASDQSLSKGLQNSKNLSYWTKVNTSCFGSFVSFAQPSFDSRGRSRWVEVQK